MTKTKPLIGSIQVPGDKSISHRAIMLGSIAEGTTTIYNFLQGLDCIATINAFRQMGIDINNDADNNKVVIKGKGLYGLKKPDKVIDVGNSGTTIRLLSGILCGQGFDSVLTGDNSIRSRPMNRIITPLSMMNGKIKSVSGDGLPPLEISSRGDKPLKAISYTSPVASAQVKSSILLAGLYADGQTRVIEPNLSRNHTEITLNYFGASINQEGNTTTITPNPRLKGQVVNVPGDISSAAYFIAAGLIVPGSKLLIKDVGINPTRDGIIEICRKMKGNISLENIREWNGEQVADIYVEHSNLQGVDIGGSIIPRLIDELPIIAIMACFADGTTTIRDAEELMVKETNRIDVMVNNLQALGANIIGTDDGMIIRGGKPLFGGKVESKNDHRIAMSFAIANLMTEGDVDIVGQDCVNISYPSFFDDLNSLIS
ncbi:MAG: 3-phosphoshikimate 1-carboxyvinyltransferase [Clostridiales bacterium]|nr:3-phosphoshikimate 1-carboxyvinyltransferase [Clostridiales bacterium]